MISSAFRVHECCSACRRPVGRCACSSTARMTYPGILLRGEWKEMPRWETREEEDLEPALAA